MFGGVLYMSGKVGGNFGVYRGGLGYVAINRNGKNWQFDGEIDRFSSLL